MNRLALAVMLFAAPAFAQQKAPDPPALKVPAQVTAGPGDPCWIKAETNASKVHWRVRTPGLHVVGADKLADKLELLCWAVSPGMYHVEAVAAVGGEVAFATTVVVVGHVPTPPSPVPPPPGPAPVPPAPTDPLAAELQKLYAAAPDAVAAAKLAGVYRDGAAALPYLPPITVTQLFDQLRRVSLAAGVPADALKAVRERLRAECKAVLPNDPEATLDDATRAKVADLFKRIASALATLR